MPGTVLSALDIFTYLIFIRSQEVCVIILITHFPDEREAQKLSNLPKITYLEDARTQTQPWLAGLRVQVLSHFITLPLSHVYKLAFAITGRGKREWGKYNRNGQKRKKKALRFPCILGRTGASLPSSLYPYPHPSPPQKPLIPVSQTKY